MQLFNERTAGNGRAVLMLPSGECVDIQVCSLQVITEAVDQILLRHKLTPAVETEPRPRG